MNHYQQTIRETMARTGHVAAADPRHVEAWIRVENPTLDGLSRSQFTNEVLIALQCVASGPLSDSEALATGFGL